MADKKDADSNVKTETSVKEEVMSDDEAKARSDKKSVESSSSKTSDKAEEPVPSKKKKIKLTVNHGANKHCVEIAENAMGIELKEAVCKICKMPEEQACLIFSGRELKNDETLVHHNVKDGNTVHLIKKPQPAQVKPQPESSQTPLILPFGLETIGGLPGLGSLGLGETDFVQFQQQIQSQILGRPDLLRQLMGNSFVQSMMTDPDTIKQLVQNNPLLKGLIDKNPEINQILNDPDALQRTMTIAQNPTMLQELMRNPNMLPFTQATTETLQQAHRERESRSATAKEEPSSASKTSGASKQKSTESSSAASHSDSKVSSTDASQAGESKSSESETKSEDSKTETVGGIFSSPEIRGMLQQMVQNPELMQNMLSLPYMKTVMETMSANPHMAAELLTSNPILNNNKQLREQIEPMVPHIMSQLQNPAIHKFITSPDALQALASIYEGLDQLHQTVPQVFQMIPGMQPSPQVPSEASGASPAAPSTDNSETTASDSSTPAGENQDFSRYMRLMMDALSRCANMAIRPEERFQSQLAQLQAMGFTNTEDNIQALVETCGDVNSAIDKLIQKQV